MPKTEAERQHKKRQRHRYQERRQVELNDLLNRITPVEKSPLFAMNGETNSENHSIEKVYQAIPPLASPQDFWERVPDDCNPMEAVHDGRIIANQGKFGHDKYHLEKLRKKLKGKVTKGHITKEEQERLWNLHGRPKKMRKTEDSTAEDGEGIALLSSSRGQRKAWQVENFVFLLRDKLKPGMTVVDFGSGSGNLCLALAAFFPDVNFVLVDKKTYPLQLAERRAQSAGIKNVKVQEFAFSPDNLKSYEPPVFEGRKGTESPASIGKRSFDLGIGLHCCGSFTDMVMEMCQLESADCIVCPCCNGGMTAKKTGGYNYPRSSFMQCCVTEEEYLLQLSKSADNAKNYTAKCWIEYDRALWAQEHGFSKVDLWKMTPVECTPKHHVLHLRI